MFVLRRVFLCCLRSFPCSAIKNAFTVFRNRIFKNRLTEDFGWYKSLWYISVRQETSSHLSLYVQSGHKSEDWKPLMGKPPLSTRKLFWEAFVETVHKNEGFVR